MATIIKCVECPDREFDNPGSARGHANRLGHHTVELDESLTLEQEADAILPEPTANTSTEVAPTFTGELGAQLEELAEVVRANYSAGQRAYKATWTAYRHIAEALAKARELLREDGEYRRWVKEQNFPFSNTIEGEWRRIGERIEMADEFVDTSVAETGEVPGRRKILKAVTPAKPKPEPEDEYEDYDEDDEEPRKSATDVIQAFLYGPAAEALALSEPGSEYWQTVSAEDRHAFSREFRTLIDRLVAINESWKES